MKFLGNTPILKGKKIKDMFVSPFKVNSSFITVFYKQSENKHIAVSVKKGIADNNANRNYIKRLLREAYKKTENHFPNKYNYFVLSIKNPVEYNFNDLVNDFKKAGKKINESIK